MRQLLRAGCATSSLWLALTVAACGDPSTQLPDGGSPPQHDAGVAPPGADGGTSPADGGTAPTSAGPAKSMGAGVVHTCQLGEDSSVWCWGYGNQGQLGVVDLLDPQIETGQPQYVGSGWAKLAVGPAHNCGIKLDGSLWCWGWNPVGELGFPTMMGFSALPGRVGTDSDWTFISASIGGNGAFANSCAIKQNGTLWCWGFNGSGQLGTGDTTNAAAPVQVGTDTDWVEVSNGGLATCGRKQDKSLWCWGSNVYGHQGSGDLNTPNLVPTRFGTESDWETVDVGYQFACGLRANDALWCWGTQFSNTLAPVQPLTGAFTQLSVAAVTACARRADGTLWCLGQNATGELGDGTQVPSLQKFVQVGAEAGWKSVAAGYAHTCGIKEDGGRYCWGSNVRGQLGLGFTASKRTPSNVAGNDTWEQLSAGGQGTTCGVRPDGTLWCWGVVSSTNTGMAQTPHQVGQDTDWRAVFSGQGYRCAIKTDGSLYCWGLGFNGALGNGQTFTSQPTPLRIGTSSWKQVSLAGSHTCGVQSDGTLWCWGGDSDGQLGLPDSSTSQLVPTQVGTDTDWTEVTTGTRHTCALKSTGEAFCMGRGFDGELGAGDGVNTSDVPVKVATEGFSKLQAGTSHTCGLKTDKTLWCWGNNQTRQINAEPSHFSVPVQVEASSDWADLATGGGHTCGVKTSGDLVCWGFNADGQIGNGAGVTMFTQPPSLVGQAGEWKAVTAGITHSCGTRTDGSVACWGLNNLGQLGDDSTWRTLPTQLP